MQYPLVCFLLLGQHRLLIKDTFMCVFFVILLCHTTVKCTVKLSKCDFIEYFISWPKKLSHISCSHLFFSDVDDLELQITVIELHSKLWKVNKYRQNSSLDYMLSCRFLQTFERHFYHNTPSQMKGNVLFSFGLIILQQEYSLFFSHNTCRLALEM